MTQDNMTQGEPQQQVRRITDLESRVSMLADQAKRDQQLLLHLQQRLDELEKRVTQMELEPPSVESEE